MKPVVIMDNLLQIALTSKEKITKTLSDLSATQ